MARLRIVILRWSIAVLLLVAGCSAKPEDRALQAARQEAAAGRLEQAMAIVDAQLAHDPQAIAAHRERVCIFLQAGQLNAAKLARAKLPADDRVLTKALNHPSPDVRANAAQLLAEHASPDQFRLFVRGVDHRDAAVRLHCARALGHLRDRRAVRPLFRLLRDSYWLVRAEAVDALTELGDPRAAGWFVRLLRDSDGYVRSRASAGLREIAGPENHEVLRAGLDWVGAAAPRLELAAALNQLGDPLAFGPLTDAARSTEATQRRRAAQLIGETGWIAASNLVERLRTDPDATVRDQAERSRLALQRLVAR
ncbi:HEAT repeat domain-containing protein [bacterium]|nr:HEAT repeat domain-containing protein [bacterium]